MIKGIVQSMLGRFGLRLARISQHNPLRDELRPFLTAMKGRGFGPRNIVDVGANRGYWTRQAMEFFPDAHYTMVEPQAELRRYVNDLVAAGRSIDWINAGISDAPGQLELNVYGRDDASSFVALGEGYGIERQVVVGVRTLDEIVASSGRPTPELVKIDAEGFDLKVLAGASTLFGKVEIFLVEAMVACSVYENSAP